MQKKRSLVSNFPNRKLRLSMLKASESKHLKFEIMSMFPGNQSLENLDIKPNDAERIDASVKSKESKIYAAKRLSRFFELEVNLRIFGNLVWSWKFPPEK